MPRSDVSAEFEERQFFESIVAAERIRYVSLAIVLPVLGVAGGVVVAYAAWNDFPILPTIVFYSLCAIPLAFAATVSRVRQASAPVERTIALTSSQLVVKDRAGSEAYPFEDCVWFPGFAEDDAELAYLPIRRSAWIVVLPSGRKVACGLTDSAYDTWRRLFQETSSRQVIRWEGALGWAYFFGAVVGAAGGGWVGWRLGAAIARELGFAAFAGGVEFAFRMMFAMSLAWLGVAWPWLLPRWSRGTADERRKLLQSSLAIPVLVAFLARMKFGAAGWLAWTLAIAGAATFASAAWWLTRRRG